MRNVWAIVVLILAALGSLDVLAIMHIQATGPELFIGGIVASTITTLMIGAHLSDKVERVNQQVNGRMSELIRSAVTPVPPVPPVPPADGGPPGG
jgi:uncharacterized membrane protein (DUF4010 family)